MTLQLAHEETGADVPVEQAGAAAPAEQSGAAAPVLLLHGLFGSSTNWRSVARQLGASRRVLSVDLRNHGASPWADSMSYLEMADDVLRLLDRLGLERPDVVGHSMGGKVAMTMALTTPQRLRRLVVVYIAPVTYPDRLSTFVQAMRSIDTAAATSRTEVQRWLAQRIPEPEVAPFLVQNLVLRNEHFDWRINLSAIAASMTDLSSFPPSLLGARFDGATSLIHGARSDYVSATDLQALQTMFPRVQVTTIDGAGHWVHADRPADFIAAVRSALDDTR